MAFAPGHGGAGQPLHGGAEAGAARAGHPEAEAHREGGPPTAWRDGKRGIGRQPASVLRWPPTWLFGSPFEQSLFKSEKQVPSKMTHPGGCDFSELEPPPQSGWCNFYLPPDKAFTKGPAINIHTHCNKHSVSKKKLH